MPLSLDILSQSLISLTIIVVVETPDRERITQSSQYTQSTKASCMNVTECDPKDNQVDSLEEKA